MGQENNDRSGQLVLILLVTAAACLALYMLPDELFGLSIKKMDMLSDLRVGSEDEDEDSNLSRADSVLLRGDSTGLSAADRERLAYRDSMYRAIMAQLRGDTLKAVVEDFSVGHIGLRRFFAALNGISTLGRPVRVAFLGDSFIEGDILTADFRERMQARFGGRGVGFVPVSSQVAQFRPTVRLRSKGWTTRSILSDRKPKYLLSCLLFDAANDAPTIAFETTDYMPHLKSVGTLKFLYTSNRATDLRWICNEGRDTFTARLPETDGVGQYVAKGSFTEGKLAFTHAQGLQALGIALEDDHGVVVDNFALRGNSGLPLENLDIARCQSLQGIRPYDLIVIQYGLNVAVERTKDYGFYRDRMVAIIKHIRTCFPGADVLLLGVSDRSKVVGGERHTMSAVKNLRRAQREAALEAGVAFWDVYEAMGGEDGMVNYVKRNWAAKDYTHLSFQGGRELANALYDAIILEKTLYDNLEKTQR